MSHQYGPPSRGQGQSGPGPYGQRPPVGPPPSAQPATGRGQWRPQGGPSAPTGPGAPQRPGGWGPRGPGGPQGPGGPRTPFGTGPGQQGGRPPQQQQNLPRLLAIIGGALAVLLIIGGTVLVLSSGDDQQAGPGQQASTDASSPTPTSTSPRTPKPGEVEIGRGVFFVPAAGWQRDKKFSSGANYWLPNPRSPGKYLGWFWARQSELRNAKEFAQHLADIESNNLEHVVIRQGHYFPCPSKTLKACYAINYSAVVKSTTAGKKPFAFRGQIQSFERPDGVTTATDTALVDSAFKARYPDVQRMIATMHDSL